MGRPKRVFPERMHMFNKLHTTKVKMYSGVSITALHQIKETPQYYMSLETWSASCSKFKKKKKYLPKLDFDIPTLTDKDAISFLETNAWHDHVERELTGRKVGLFNDGKPCTQMIETIALLDRIFPHHEKVYFYELKQLISSYNHGTFVEYDRETGKVEEPSEHDIDGRKHHTKRYRGTMSKDSVVFPDWIVKLRDKYFALSKKTKDAHKCDKVSEAFKKYYDAEKEYLYEHHDLTNTFIEVCKNAVVLPHAYTHPTVEGSAYEHAGEVYFIVTADKIYFEVERHF